MTEKRRALIIANSDYQDSALHRLASPAEDAKELASVLGDGNIGGFEVETLMNQTSARVSEAIEEFFVFSSPKPDDLLLFYFSGHGVTDEEGNLYFAATDTQFVKQRIRRATAVSADFVDSVMRRSRSRRQILMLDCCHGGAFAEGMSLKGPLPSLETHFQGRGRIVLTASTAVQFSLEGSDVGGVQQPSVYTRTLLEGLKTGDADRDADGWVSLDELHDYVLDGVHAESPQQTPTKSGYLEGQLYIARSRGARPAVLPRSLQNALQDPDPITRRGAVSELGELLAGEHVGLALAARQALEIRRDTDDSFKIRAAAANYLATHQAAGTAAKADPSSLETSKPTIEAATQGLSVYEVKKAESESSQLVGAGTSMPSRGLSVVEQKEKSRTVTESRETVPMQRNDTKVEPSDIARVSPEDRVISPQHPPRLPLSLKPDLEVGTTSTASRHIPYYDRASKKARLVIGCVCSGILVWLAWMSIWTFAVQSQFDSYWIFLLPTCISGLLVPVVLRWFAPQLRVKYLIFISLTWLLSSLYLVLAAQLSMGTFATFLSQCEPWFGQFPMQTDYFGHIYLTLYLPRSILRGGLIGLILASAMARKRWTGAFLCTASTVISDLFWLIPMFIVRPSQSMSGLFSALAFTVGLALLLWYANGRIKLDEKT